MNNRDELLKTLIQAVDESGFSVSGPTDTRAAEHGEPAWVCNARAVIAEASSASGPRYRPGTVFRTVHRHPRTCTVVDVHCTYNLAGEPVKVRYVATHEFAGQTVTDRDVPEFAIARGLISEPA